MVRAGPRVERSRHSTLAEALAELERRAGRVAAGARVPAVDLGTRRYEPAQRVAARLELRGPDRVRGGVDVRGDGSLHPYRGRWQRREIASLAGETPWAALRRALEPPG